ncbi:MAG: hypothetical protein AUH86_19065 [Acidobacteria bacterium 13_1_40CM_4_58_4]|nr:MAG: hypothetical protein AUH86_19065 [Acidobacteria bacterium 13_1_40CM_4_58_4]
MLSLAEETCPKNLSALRLNQFDRIFETALAHFEKFSDAGLVVVSHHKDNIERGIKKPQGHRQETSTKTGNPQQPASSWHGRWVDGSMDLPFNPLGRPKHFS